MRVHVPPAAQVVWSNLWGLTFFHEPLTAAGGAGAAFIVAGVLVVTLPAGRQQPSRDQLPRPGPERAHSLLHKLLAKCPQCGAAEQEGGEVEEGAEAAGGASKEPYGEWQQQAGQGQRGQKQPLLGPGFTMVVAASAGGAGRCGAPVLGQLHSAPSTAQLLSEALAGSEACSGRSVQPAQAAERSPAAAASGPAGAGGLPLLLCRTCSCGLQAEDRAASAASWAMFSARSSFATRSGSSRLSSDYSIGSWAPRRQSSGQGD
jgi:hypothetical protein